MGHSPDKLDLHVGRRVRQIRRERMMSQVELAEGLGISHQQVHKYEVGRDRIGASRLERIAAILGVPLRAFFEAPEDAERAAALIGANPRAVEIAWSDKAIMEMGAVLADLDNAKARRAFIELCTAVAESKSRR